MPCLLGTVNQDVVLGIIFRQGPLAVNNGLIASYSGEFISYGDCE